MAEYKFDRSAFRVMTFQEFDAANKFGKEVSFAERLRQAYYLISKAYGFTMSDQLRLDKNFFSIRKMND
jgi:hypothetical protein